MHHDPRPHLHRALSAELLTTAEHKVMLISGPPGDRVPRPERHGDVAPHRVRSVSPPSACLDRIDVMKLDRHLRFECRVLAEKRGTK